MNIPIIACYSLSKAFDGIQAVKNVDLEIAPGTFVALLGPSGCGKTTVLRLLAGLETPDTGVSYLHPGLGKRPLHACSCSKAVAAFSPDLLLAQNLEGRLKAYTEFTLTRVEDLEAELEIIRQRGYAECVEEIERGMCSVATTLSSNGAGATLSIGATGSTRVFNPAFREKIGQEIIRLAREILDGLCAHVLDEPADKTAPRGPKRTARTISPRNGDTRFG